MNKPFDSYALMMELVGESCIDDTESELEANEETLNQLYENKSDYEDMLYDDECRGDYASAKMDKKRIAQIKDEIIKVKNMMQHNTTSKEEMTVA